MSEERESYNTVIDEWLKIIRNTKSPAELEAVLASARRELSDIQYTKLLSLVSQPAVASPLIPEEWQDWTCPLCNEVMPNIDSVAHLELDHNAQREKVQHTYPRIEPAGLAGAVSRIEAHNRFIDSLRPSQYYGGEMLNFLGEESLYELFKLLYPRRGNDRQAAYALAAYAKEVDGIDLFQRWQDEEQAE